MNQYGIKNSRRYRKEMISPGIEPGTFSVLTKCDNRYTTKPAACRRKLLVSRLHIVAFMIVKLIIPCIQQNLTTHFKDLVKSLF